MSKVLSALGSALPDDRPLLSLQIVESVAKCPTGYWPVSRTYDEDSDAGLMKQNGLFGKKPSHYICLSKSEGVPGYVMDGVVVVGEREPAPAGFSVAGRAGKRRLCTRVSRAPAAALSAAPALSPPVADVIVCSKMRQAPQGFILAGEINGKVVCYKLCGAEPRDYENVVSHVTPEASRRLRIVPERPPKLSPLISDLNNLNLKSPPAHPAAPAYPVIEEFTTGHDYESLSPSYNIKPTRPAPRPPSQTDVMPANSPGRGSPGGRARRGAAALPRGPDHTLGGYCGLEGVPFVLSPRLRGLPSDALTQLPVIKARTKFELERDYSYSFTVERQA